MATISKLVIRLQTDATGLREGLERGKRLLQEFGRDATRAVLPGNAYVTAGERAASQLVAGLRNKYVAEMRASRDEYARGAISETSWKNAGLLAAERFNEGLLRGRDRLQAQQLLSKNTDAILSRELMVRGVNAEKKINEAVAAERRKAAIAASFDPRLGARTTSAQRQADTLLKTATAQYDRTILDLRTRLAAGMDPSQYKVLAAQATGVFNRELVTGLGRLEGLKSFNENVRRVVVDNFKLTGREATNALGQSIGGAGAAAGNLFAQQFISKATQANRVAAVGRTMTLAVTAPIVAAGVAATNVAKNFESAMLRMQARTGATESELARLAAGARRIGAETQFTATEVAETQRTLAERGGFNIGQILQATQPVINLAASQNLELARSAEITAAAMRQFGLAAEDTPRIVDLLAKASQMGGVSVEFLSTALSYVGPAAARSGLSLEDVSAVLVALARTGITASRAGTTLNGVLENLQAPTKQQAAYLRGLRVDVLGANNQIRPLAAILGQLSAKIKQAGYDYALFGQRAGIGAGALMTLGAEKLLTFRKELDNFSGTAARNAAAQMAGLLGGLRELTGAVEELALAFSSSGLLSAVSSAVRYFTDFVRVLGQMPPTLLKLLTGFLAFAAILGPMLYTLSKLVVMFNVLRATMLLTGGTGGILGLVARFTTLGAMLTTGGIIIVGLGLLAAWLWQSGKAARDAERDFQKYQERLVSITNAKGAVSEIESLNRELADALNQQNAARAKLAAVPERGRLTVINGIPVNPLAGVERDLARADARVALLTRRLNEANTVWRRFQTGEDNATASGRELQAMLDSIGAINDRFPIDAFGSSERGRSAVDMMVDRVREIVELFQAARDGGMEVVTPISMMAQAATDTARMLDRIPDKFGKGAQDAVKLLRAMETLRDAQREARVEDLRQFQRDVNGRPMPNAPQTRVIAPPVTNLIVDTTSGFRRVAADLAGETADLRFNFAALGEIVQEGVPRLGEFLRDLSGLSGGIQALASLIATPEKLTARTASGATDVFGTASNVMAVVSQVGAAVGAVTSVVSLLTESSRRNAEIQQRNTEALTQLRVQLERDARGAGLNVDARRAMQEIARQFGGFATLGTGFGPSRTAGAPPELLASILSSFSLTFDQLNDIAQSYGITILDRGRLVGSGLTALSEALGLSAAALGRFRQTLDDQREALLLLQNVQDVEQTPVRQIQNGLDLLRRFAPQLAERFAGMDAATEAGRAAIKNALVSLVQTIIATGVSAEQLGSLADLSELISIITGIEGAFDTLAESANKVTAALNNVPSGFRIALRTFESLTPRDPGPGLAPRPLTPPQTPQTMPIMPVSGPVVYSATPSVVIEGDVSIVAQPGETSEQAFDAWVRSKQRAARGRGLPSSEWPRVAGGT